MHGSVEWRLSSDSNFMGYDAIFITQSISKLAVMTAINISRSSSGWLRRWRNDWTGPWQRCRARCESVPRMPESRLE